MQTGSINMYLSGLYMLCMQQAEEAAAQEEAAPDPSMLSQEMLRKYITFAKQNCHPKLANADYEKISQVGWPADTS
jgi:DNA replicative helicase MCM subunit Mcm2 (Cdc46/Mcm family)